MKLREGERFQAFEESESPREGGTAPNKNGAVTSAVLVHLRVEPAHFDWRWRERPALTLLAWEALARDPQPSATSKRSQLERQLILGQRLSPIAASALLIASRLALTAAEKVPPVSGPTGLRGPRRSPQLRCPKLLRRPGQLTKGDGLRQSNRSAWSGFRPYVSEGAWQQPSSCVLGVHSIGWFMPLIPLLTRSLRTGGAIDCNEWNDRHQTLRLGHGASLE